jgi:hypothetical protein
MPVNMDPAKKHRRDKTVEETHNQNPSTVSKKTAFGEETEEDRVKALADAESKNLWDATEVIDMDPF